jgi:NADPH2:quinone reductase
MRAVIVEQSTGPDDLVVKEWPEPGCGDGAVLIDVQFAGVSFPDLLLSRGEYQLKPDPPFVLGSEAAGVVREAGEGSGFVPGQRVAALSLGTFAETAVAPGLMTFPLPDELSFEQGAGLVMNYHTADFALRVRGELREGESILIHGAAGGVGTAGIQVAKAMGARVLAVVSSEDKAQTARQAGADEVLLTSGDWRQEAKDLTGGGVDVVLDPVGGERFTDSLRSLTDGGRLLVVGFTEGSIPEVKVNRLLLRNLSVVGVAWGSYIATRPEAAREIGDRVNEMAVAGKIYPLIGATYPLEQAADALRELQQRRVRGKIVLQVR